MDTEIRGALVGGAVAWLLAFGMALVFLPDHERTLAVFGVGTLLGLFAFAPIASAALTLAGRWSPAKRPSSANAGSPRP